MCSVTAYGPCVCVSFTPHHPTWRGRSHPAALAPRTGGHRVRAASCPWQRASPCFSTRAAAAAPTRPRVDVHVDRRHALERLLVHVLRALVLRAALLAALGVVGLRLLLGLLLGRRLL